MSSSVCESLHLGITHLSPLVPCLLSFAAANPWLMALAIIAATFIHEDIATVTTGVMAADKVTSVEVALPALYVGIVLGDIGLYGLGRLIASNRYARRVTRYAQFAAIKAWLDTRLVAGVFAVRFIPGLRLSAYTTYGFFTMPFQRFALSVVGAASIWTTGLFYLSYEFGAVTAQYLGLWRWPIILVAFIVPIVAISRLVRRRVPDGLESAPPTPSKIGD